MEPSPSAPIDELPPPPPPDDRGAPEEALALEETRLVADRMAEVLREEDCAPLELDTVRDPSAPTELPPPPEPPLAPLDEVPEARELTWLLELRDALNERLSRPKPEREPRSCGARSCA